jgi:oligopeptide transport system ATP-binding protein
MKPIIKITNLNVKFLLKNQMLHALKNIDFTIYQNETIAIVGESGSGKTILTRAFTNLLESNGLITSGQIEYCGSMPKCFKKQSSYELTNLHHCLLG